ncbi:MULTISPECIES: type-F conjugative transfer system pilin assembly protein TrbC [unclassified Novosphingobium]|uniref:type-F conjugative transfer system pilin assembly protein TrbC n=1 Tax=unclassified Novosphingobium TaxID=2644732 RepID=UPI00146F70A2|nr:MULTISPECIES: type-F conjugative transfer system pilin assembly protein TrbC [unclassified Novosphingobium]NMN06780.1 type-F conjugative transfer system pilin assembly protein TrbC [Novosphingobium sp. SG919]NMN88769.1 type-F conjugative transfer system pilin assembly protein TrbC [Novosphingobium sp. SG916]
MRISMPSIRNAALILAVGAATAALAQDATRDAPSGNARQSTADQGQTVMDRLGRAVKSGKDAAGRAPDPRLPRTDNPADRRRAFEALRGRTSMPEMEARARAAQAKGEASLAAERERQAKALRQALGLEPAEEQALAKAAPAVAGKGWVPVLFVSSSMPISTLRSYAAQLERAHGVMAFRGVPGGLKRMGPMAKLTAQILRLDPGCEGPNCVMRDVQLIVDPIVFRQHGIAQVPALAMIPGDPTQAYCERDDDSPRAAHVVFGDSALSGMLEEYARLGGKEEVSHAQALLVAR